ncbi:MAG: serine recombinase [Planctomycetes bacterium]|nr:serine recombinase [Planctomycetota bacterium]
MRAVIYARYSSDLQSGASIEDQIRLCRERIDREAWGYVQAYTDRGISGSSAMLRPAYQAVIEDARRGLFDIVVAEALDRLSRDQEDVAALFKRLKFSGVSIVTLAEGEVSELHVGLKGTMNALFLKDLADKTRRGLRGRVEQGRSGGGLCYGYDVVRATGPTGEPVNGERAINTVEAAIVRRIFEAFAAGQSPRAIAKQLNAERVPGPSGRAWGDTTIRGHITRGTGLLNNALYAGQLIWNRQRYVKDPATGKRVSRLNPSQAWIVKEVPELRIVPDPLWKRVQSRLQGIRSSAQSQNIRRHEFWKRRRPQHLLTGCVFCGVCGGSMASVGKDYLACARARRNGTCTNRGSIRRGLIEELILNALKENLMAPDLVKESIAAFLDEIAQNQRSSAAAGEAKRRELADVRRKLASLIDAIADGLGTECVKARLEELEQRKSELEATITAPPSPAVQLHPNIAELYRRKVAELSVALRNPQSGPEAMQILRSLVEAVRLTPTADGFEIELVGDIARMVELAQEAGGRNATAAQEGAAVSEAFVRSIKVVAGRGFEPLTFRL